ncbi:MAG: methyltransferase domain-containing protein [Chloroflexi bacterium]|nr:MAG: methyltransferase domain-containing protein [Chloroflexota bacterium]
MSYLPSPEEKAAYVNRMFAEIAPRYDLMNRLMTGGQDVAWRRELIGLCDLPPHGALLDVGTGTGDIAKEALRQHPGIIAIGCDFTYEMMAVGKGAGDQGLGTRDWPARVTRSPIPSLQSPILHFSQGDALHLPFPDQSFDAVTSGFLLRNVTDLDAALAEQVRVTKPGGRVICLETAPPSQVMLGPAVRFYMFRVLPLLGKLISPRGSAYQYLPNSTRSFPEPDVLALKMERAGLKNVFYRRKMLGTVAIHVGSA